MIFLLMQLKKYIQNKIVYSEGLSTHYSVLHVYAVLYKKIAL